MRKASLDVIAVLHSEEGCSWAEREYSVQMQTIGLFNVEYADDFSEAVTEWVADNLDDLKNDCVYQILMTHVFEHDGAGATVGRYFKIIDVSFESY